MATVISFRIDDEDKELLQRIADEYDTTISWAVRSAIKQYLTNLTKENENENDDNLYLKGDEAIGRERPYTDCDNT